MKKRKQIEELFKSSIAFGIDPAARVGGAGVCGLLKDGTTIWAEKLDMGILLYMLTLAPSTAMIYFEDSTMTKAVFSKHNHNAQHTIGRSVGKNQAASSILRTFASCLFKHVCGISPKQKGYIADGKMWERYLQNCGVVAHKTSRFNLRTDEDKRVAAKILLLHYKQIMQAYSIHNAIRDL